MTIKEGKLNINSKPFFKKGQLTLFVIIALIIVFGFILFFLFKDNFIKESIPVTIQPVYNSLDSCFQEATKDGVYLLEMQGGYIYPPDYHQGSYAFPSSSYLAFFGNRIPFWDYFSASSIEKEQIPTKEGMEAQLKQFIESKINDCDFSTNYQQGFDIDFKDINVFPKIEKNKILIDSNLNLNIKLNNQSFLIKNYHSNIKSNLGLLYEDAIKVYDKEKKELILENYTIDILRLYAPVDDFEVSCSPKIWNIYDIYSDLKDAIEVNIQSISSEKSSDQDSKYFYRNFKTEGVVKFLTFNDWPFFLEANPSQGNLLIANPVGNTPELSILGFCFIPYHFVYSLNYPVLIQISKDDETFQFPIIVYIDKNKPKIASTKSINSLSYEDICSDKSTPIKVQTYDSFGNSIPFSVDFECVNEKCYIGNSSSNNDLTFLFPPCVNGVLTVSADNFVSYKEILDTTVKGQEFQVILTPKYNLSIGLFLDNLPYNEYALVSFNSEENSQTIIYPDEKEISLSSGAYNISVNIYKNSSITLPETETELCTPIKKGIKGFFGITEKSCSKIKIPSQLISSFPYAGGNINNYLLEEDIIKNANVIQLNVRSLKIPKDFLEIQQNMLLIDKNLVEVRVI